MVHAQHDEMGQGLVLQVIAKQALYTQRETRHYGPELWKNSDF